MKVTQFCDKHWEANAFGSDRRKKRKKNPFTDISNYCDSRIDNDIVNNICAVVTINSKKNRRNDVSPSLSR